MAVSEYRSFAKLWQEKGCSSQAETWQVKNIMMKCFDWQVKFDVFVVSMATARETVFSHPNFRRLIRLTFDASALFPVFILDVLNVSDV